MAIIEYIPTYNYFNKFTRIDKNAAILDFGSNSGNFLRSSKGLIQESLYTGVDVDAHAIEQGRSLHPNATWETYDRYNPAYNPNGSKILPVLGRKYDLIVSYSVFTHMTYEDMTELLEYLYSVLTSDGVLLFTVCDIQHLPCTEWFRKKRGECDIIQPDNFGYLIDNKYMTVPDDRPCTHFVSFYNTGWLVKALIKYNAEIFGPPKGWTQSCVKIKKQPS